MSPRGYRRREPGCCLRLDCLQNLRVDHLRCKHARLEGIHPNRDTPPSKTHAENKGELVQGCFRQTVRHLIESSEFNPKGMNSSTYTRSGSRGAEFGRNAADIDDA